MAKKSTQPPSKEDLKKARLKRKKEAWQKLKRVKLKQNGVLPFIVTSCITLSLAYVAYNNALIQDGYDVEEAYVIQNVAMYVETDKGYESKILTPSATLTIYGDDEKVRKLKKANIIPEVELKATGKEEGVYEIKPQVKDTLIDVHYQFSPATVDVQVLQAERRPFEVMERYYGVAQTGYYIERIIADEQAMLLLTEDEMLEVGYVVADLDASTVTESGTYQADVVVLDKRGNLLDVPIETEKINVQVTFSMLNWYQRQQDINALKEEISTLETELAERRAKLPTVTDLLQRTDLEKEIQFREKRLPIKKQELLDKETGLSQAKENEESLKQAQKQQALLSGGSFKEVVE